MGSLNAPIKDPPELDQGRRNNLEIPVVKATQPKAVSVNLESVKLSDRNPANIPSLKKQHPNRPNKSKKLKVKKMPDVFPALEQLFEKDETAVPMEPIVAPPQINEAQRLMDQVTAEVGKKPKRLSEML